MLNIAWFCFTLDDYVETVYGLYNENNKMENPSNGPAAKLPTLL